MNEKEATKNFKFFANLAVVWVLLFGASIIPVFADDFSSQLSSDESLNYITPSELEVADQLAEIALVSGDDFAVDAYLRLSQAAFHCRGSSTASASEGPEADWLVQEQLAIREQFEPLITQNGGTLPPLDVGGEGGDPPPVVIPHAQDDETIEFSMNACMGAIAAADAAVVGYYAACRGFRRITPTCAAAGAAALGVMAAAVVTCEMWARNELIAY